MLTFYDSENQPHVLGERLGGGGEGSVFACEKEYSLVAKIYSEPISDEKAAKLLWMAANKDERLLKVAAWVIDVLRDAPGGKVVGFLMPSVAAKEIHELYSLKSRRIYFPDATWHFLVHTAANVARAFFALHRERHVMGDVNHGNLVVMRDGTVKLIDCDSYAVRTETTRYACEVATATHLAPELQGADLSRVEREDKHDNFGLAVIIFQLLFLGRHPFAGNFAGGEDKSLEDCIREQRFAYGASAQKNQVRQPPGTLPLEAASPRIALLFERAFLTEQERPEPKEWVEALEDLAAHLKQCALHPGHLFFDALAHCPWCEIETQTGLMLFPFVTTGAHLGGETQPFNIFTVENLIASFGVENNLPAPLSLPKTAAPLPASPEVLETKKSNRRLTVWAVPAHAGILIFLISTLGVVAGFYFGIMLAAFLIFYLYSCYKSASQPLKETLTDAERRFEKLEKDRAQARVPQTVAGDLIKIRKKVGEYQTVQRRSAGELKLLQTETTKRELYKFLHSKTIAEQEIDGIGKGARKSLIAAGVKTAAEIDENRLRHFYKIDAEFVAPLVDWRARLAADFAADDASRAAIKSEEDKLVEAAAKERRSIERDIKQLLILLRGGAAHAQKQQRALLSKSETLARQIAQTKSDLHALGNSAAAIVALVLITIFVPLFGVALTDSGALRDPISSHGYGSSQISSQSYARGANAALDHSAALAAGENMTDEQIANLSDAARDDYANRFYNEAVKYNYDAIDRQKAERYSRVGLRFQGTLADEARLRNQLGYALYGQGKTRESIDVLDDALDIDKFNNETKIFLSMNYLARTEYGESIRLMSEVTKDDPHSFEGFYNLGLAYEGLRDYSQAEAAYWKAVEIKPEDAGIHYHLGFALYRLQKYGAVRREYETLSQLNKGMAQKLADDAHLKIEPSVSVEVNPEEPPKPPTAFSR